MLLLTRASVITHANREKLDMVANIDIRGDNRKYFPVHPESLLSRKFCEVTEETEDARLLCQDCMCHFCNRFFMRNNKKISHTLAMLGLVMRHTMVHKIPPEWISGKSPGSRKIRRASTTFE